MMNSAAAAAGLYSDGVPTEPSQPSNRTPERGHPSSGQLPHSDAKTRDKDRERRRAEKVSSRRDGIEPPAVMPAQDQPVHSLIAPSRSPDMTPPPGAEPSDARSRPRRQSQPIEDSGVDSDRSFTFDDRSSQLDLLRRGREVLAQHGSGSEGRQQRESGKERERGHRRRHSSPDRASMRGPSHQNSRPITPREQHDADAIQASIDGHAERLRADVEGDEQPLPRLGRERGQSSGSSGTGTNVSPGGTGTGPFMTRDEHERRKKERAARLASMRQEAASQWRNSSATDDPLGREWASRQKGGKSREVTH